MDRILTTQNLALKLLTVRFLHGLKPGDKAPDFSGYDQNGTHDAVQKDSGERTNGPFLLLGQMVLLSAADI